MECDTVLFDNMLSELDLKEPDSANNVKTYTNE